MIRAAKLQDIAYILTITKACASAMIEKNIYQWNEHYPSKQAFENDLDRGELFVIENDQEILGCITISTYMDVEYEPIQWLTEDNQNVYIHRLAIEPKYQGKGYAQELMDFAEDFASEKGFSSIRLDTFSQNQRNQRFYEQRGYQRLGNVYFPKQSEHPFFCYEKILCIKANP
ncbi:GNAT family N-acetyltransferase [Sungkyunkwania multivorans]|uniref:GNAT family N-acetyltransferase n=1 Tax=Sungkyunkwania multivorans TaxID=1173618 RepID=A0ABW3D1D6_9FLAO